MALLTITPNPTAPSKTVSVAGTGFSPRKKTRLYLDGVLTNSIMPRQDGTFNIGVIVSKTPKVQSLSAQQYIALKWIVVTTVTINVEIVPPPPPPTPPDAPTNLKAVPGDKIVTVSWG